MRGALCERGGATASEKTRGRPAPAPHALTIARAALGLSAAALVLAAGGALRYLALGAGWRAGEDLPVVFHRLVCAALAVRVTECGAPSAARPQLIAVNHISWLDICVLGSRRPVGFLAKTEVGAGRLARVLLALQGVVFVNRRRRRCIPAVNAEMARRMRAGATMVLFAEATTGDANRLLPFRSSHFEAIRQAGQGDAGEAVVQPVRLVYRRRAGLPLGRPDRPLVAWYGDMTFFSHFWRLLASGPIDCDIRHGAAIGVSAGSNRKDLARRAERAVRDLAEAAHRPAAP